MEKDSVCAVVVTYHPDAGVLVNLAALKLQVQQVVVIDNGSSGEDLRRLREAAQTFALTLIENGDNLGIATALNIGVRWGIERGIESVMLFDQDSRVTEDYVETMMRGFKGSPWGERLGILTPRYVDSRFGTALPPNLVAEGLEAAMTSGSMLRTETFVRLGEFRDELFIDGVDYEFSLRLRREGYVIDECAEAMLLHSPGEPKKLKLLGFFHYQTANYSPVRRYYQERNKVWIARRYALAFPVFCFKLFFFSTKDFIKIIVAEDNKQVKLRYFLRGVIDGIRGRMGKIDERVIKRQLS